MLTTIATELGSGRVTSVCRKKLTTKEKPTNFSCLTNPLIFSLYYRVRIQREDWKIVTGIFVIIHSHSKVGLSNAVPAGAMAPVIYFPGALFYSAGFNVNQNFKNKIFPNNSMFKFFSYHSHEHGLPAFEILFSFVPILLPLTPPFPFSH
jgi:hypothetical protein